MQAVLGLRHLCDEQQNDAWVRVMRSTPPRQAEQPGATAALGSWPDWTVPTALHDDAMHAAPMRLDYILLNRAAAAASGCAGEPATYSSAIQTIHCVLYLFCIRGVRYSGVIPCVYTQCTLARNTITTKGSHISR